MSDALTDLIERAQAWMELAVAHGDSGPWSETWTHRGIIRDLASFAAAPTHPTTRTAQRNEETTDE